MGCELEAAPFTGFKKTENTRAEEKSSNSIRINVSNRVLVLDNG
jgi:hypothetical protein